MNKKLVVLAVAGAFASPLAVQAQTANVTLYGRLNMDLEFVKGEQTDGSNPTVNRVSSNSSRFGMRGTESLGGGLNAIFQIESNVSGDTGNSASSSLGSRETFVGLQGSWGKVYMGKFLMPQDDVRFIFDNKTTLGTSLLSDGALYAQAQESKSTGGFDARTGNSLRYDSPNYMGFTAALQYSTRDSSGDTQNFINCTPALVTNVCPALAPGGGSRPAATTAITFPNCATPTCSAATSSTTTARSAPPYPSSGTTRFASTFRPPRLGHWVRAARRPRHVSCSRTTPTGRSQEATISARSCRASVFAWAWGTSAPSTTLPRAISSAIIGVWRLEVPLGGGKFMFNYGRASDGKGGAADS